MDIELFRQRLNGAIHTRYRGWVDFHERARPCGRSTLQRLVKGKGMPSVGALMSIAGALGVKVDYLLGLDEEAAGPLSELPSWLSVREITEVLQQMPARIPPDRREALIAIWSQLPKLAEGY